MNYLITGISGQDGVILSLNLLSRGHKVYGVSRENHLSIAQPALPITSIVPDCNIFRVSERLENFYSLVDFCMERDVDVIVNFWGLSSVGASFQDPLGTMNSNLHFAHNLLEVVRLNLPRVKLINAVSSEMFGRHDTKIDEFSERRPLSPYALSKSFVFDLGKYYRNNYDCCVSNAIFFNHESPLRGSQFVTSKIVSTAFDIATGKVDKLVLGNLDVSRDWGWAPDFMDAVLLLSNYNEPDDFVFSTGISNSLASFVEKVFDYFSIPTAGHLQTDAELFRPSDIPWNCGDPAKAKLVLNWEPSLDFDLMVKKLCAAHEYMQSSDLKTYRDYLIGLLKF